MEVSGQLPSPAALPPRKEPLYPLDTKLGGPQSLLINIAVLIRGVQTAAREGILDDNCIEHSRCGEANCCSATHCLRINIAVHSRIVQTVA
jgi:hypothetical protein